MYEVYVGYLKKMEPVIISNYLQESALVRSSAELDESVSNQMDNDLKPRQHPGVMSHRPVSLPEGIKKSISNILSGGNIHLNNADPF